MDDHPKSSTKTRVRTAAIWIGCFVVALVVLAFSKGMGNALYASISGKQSVSHRAQSGPSQRPSELKWDDLATSNPVAEEAKVELAHPGWIDLVRTNQFSTWVKSQPASVRRLTQSDRAEDAILVLDLYKRDVSRRP